MIIRHIPISGWIFGLFLIGVGLFLDIWAIMGKHWFIFSDFDDGLFKIFLDIFFNF